MQRIIRLNDGTEYPCSMCGMHNGQLWIHAQLGIIEACNVFTVPEKLEKIVDTYSGDDGTLREVVWKGYTELFHLSSTYGGIMQIGLKRSEEK